MLVVRVGVKETDGEGRTGLVKYVAATAALSSNVDKHALKSSWASLSISLNQCPWVYVGLSYPQMPQTLIFLPSATRDPESLSLKWTALAGIRGN